MFIIGAVIRTPAISVFSTRSNSPAKWQTSVEVPPMSKPMIRRCPAISLTLAAPTTPPAGPRQDRVLALEARRAPVSPPDDCMNMSLPRHVPVERRRHPVDVAPQDRRQIGVDDRGVPPAHHLHQRAHPVADRDLREPRRLGERRRPRLVRLVAVAVHEDDGAGAEPRRPRRRELAPPGAPRRAAPRPSRPPAPAPAPRSPAAWSISGSTICRSNSRGRFW